jgi:hypothetical protein
MKFSIDRRKNSRGFALWQVCLLSAILLLSGKGFAQLSTASLGGAVRDSSGAAVPGATIVLRNVATAVENTTTSNGAGAYLFLGITPGRYTVHTSAPSFSEQKVPEFTLTVGQSATIDFALTIGSQNTVVTVQSATPQLEASSASLGTVIDTKQVNELPLNGRDFTQLLTLTPGVSPIDNGQANSGYATPVPIGVVSTIPSVNGQGNRSNYFLTDGLSNFGTFHSVYAVPPILDEIQEFKVVSHADSAEYGSVTGGVINVVTKSGTNDLHGSAFEYARNAIFDAKTDFKPTTSFSQNEFGGAVGGPVWLPKLYNGKNKTFFFGAYQGFRYSQVANRFIKVPTAAQLAGDESSWPTKIYNPFSTRPDPANPGQYIRDPFPGNQITPDPNMVAFAKFVFPAAGPVLDSGGDNATDPTPTSQTINQWTARIDQKIGKNDSVWFRYSRDTAVTSQSSGAPGVPKVNEVPNRNYGGSYVHVFSPSLVLQAQFGRTTAGANETAFYTKGSAGIISQVGFSPAFVGNFAAAPGKNFLPAPGINGYANPSEYVALHPDVPNSNQYSGVLTKTFGRHVIDVGGGFTSMTFRAPITADSLTFGAAQTGNTNPADIVNTGDPLASFLLNVPGAADRRNGVTETRPGGVMSGFVQDSWRATSRLTINAGLRYDLTLNPPNGPNSLVGVNGGPESGNVDFNNGTYVVQKLPPLCSVRGVAPCIPDGGPGPGGLPAHVVVSPNNKLMHNTYDNIGPHFGFTFKVTDRTVVHSAFGIVFDNWAGVQQLAQNISGLWPDTGQQEAPSLNVPSSRSATPTVKAQNPFAIAANNSFFPAPTPFTQAGFEYDPNIKNPYSEQWSFGVQQLLSSSTTVTVNYVGSSSHRLDVGGVYNTAVTPSASNTPNAIGGYAGALFPYMVPSYYDRSAGRGNYNGLQASVERRYINGLSYGVAYTWSKSINVGGDGYFGVEGGVPQDPYNPARYDRSVSGLDLTHILSVNVLYDIPVGKGKSFSTKNSALDYILGNWQFNNLFQTHSGSPFTPFISSDQANTGNAGWMGYEHLNLVGNPKLSNRTAAKWFNTAAYATPALGTYGNAGRNSLRGPSYWNLDSSLFRLFPVGEGRKFEFRAEAFNLLNHVNLGQPSSDINSGSAFGTITSTNNTARQIQLSGKFIF